MRRSKTVVFTHGTMMDRTMFEPQLDALEDDYHLLAYDSRARTDNWQGPYGPDVLAADCKKVIRAGLEDVFMGKLHGISMGIDACYTNHAQVDQNDIENLAVLLAAAGANFFITVPMGDDTMLNYQSNSFHDAPALRELFDLRPAPEFEPWLEDMGILDNGRLTDQAGDPTIFT